MVSIYLATILGCWALMIQPIAAVSPATSLPFFQESQPGQDVPPSSAAQESRQNTAPTHPEEHPSQPSAERGSDQPPPSQPAQAPNIPKPPQNATRNKAKVTAKKNRRRNQNANATSSSDSGKKVVRNGSTADPVIQLAPDVSPNQVSSERESTAQILATTDTNLKQISTRQLTVTQQDSVSQIRKYIEQANAAQDAGDVQRAHNLASKALLLSDDLVKH